MKLRKPSPKTLRVAASVGMILIFGLTVMTVVNGESSFESQVTANEKVIGSLQDDIKRLEGRKAESAADKNKDLHSASDAGRKVAELQANYQTLDATANPDGVKENAASLSAYFGDDAQFGRTPWFTITKGDSKADWRFKSTYSAFESVVPVIWVCYPEGNDADLLAYVTAEFHADDGKFYDVERHMTANASRYQKAEGEDESKKALDDLIALINSQEVDDGPKQSDEDLQSNSDARSWLDSQNKKENGGD